MSRFQDIARVRLSIRSLNLLGCSLALATSVPLQSAHATGFTLGASTQLIYPPYHFGETPPAPIKFADGPYQAPYVAPRNSTSGSWIDVNNVPFTGRGGWGPLLLTDGSVIVKQAFTGTAGIWYKLTPDKKGVYTSGTWKQIASMPSGYQPDYYASQVLPDGNVLIEGGEYNDNAPSAHTNKGAIYNPVTNKWTSVSPPSGWSKIGDAESVILPNGNFMLANCCDSRPAEQAIASISGTTVTWTTSNSYHYNNEQGYTMLPDGDVLMVDVWNHGSNYDDYEIYDTSKGTWSLAGETADYLSSKGHEIGAAPLTPQGPAGGTIIQFTANQSPGVNDVYSVANGTWKAGPVLKIGTTVYDMADAPAATLPDGNVLAEASPGYGAKPAHFWEFKVASTGNVTATQVNDTNTSSRSTDYGGNLLVLPSGGVLWDDSGFSTEIAVYRPKGSPKTAWRPVVSSVNSTLTVGSKANAISGKNFNGFDLGGVYGDDSQQATNYPLVRFKNKSTGDYCYARSYNFSTMGVWTTGTTNATFDIPTTCETGASSLQVIVNGIASNGVLVTLKS